VGRQRLMRVWFLDYPCRPKVEMSQDEEDQRLKINCDNKVTN
jgi:hypothetical protein